MFLGNGVVKHPKLGESKMVVFIQLCKTGSHTATKDVQQTIMGPAYSGVLLSIFGELTDLLHLEGSTFESWSLREVCRRTTYIRKDARAFQFLGPNFVNTRPTFRLSFKRYQVPIVKIKFKRTSPA
jgi:hypothetical protein